ncbi:peptide chain release factor 2, partial [Staphylococcus aureus]|uniref:PCRF domain-containing protein n=1 Tax=Staphylococcus aureus TaxID=1280 RepID=UPI00065BF09A
YNDIMASISDNIDMVDLVEMSENPEQDILSQVENDLTRLEKEVSSMKLRTQLDGDYDKNNAYMAINAGAGGLEATDWADMLLRMYTRYFEHNGFKYVITDINNEEAGGIKSATLKVSGSYAYCYLIGENGVHRLVRISPFDSGARRHTSF